MNNQDDLIRKAEELYKALKDNFENTLGDSWWCYENGARINDNEGEPGAFAVYKFSEIWWIENRLEDLVEIAGSDIEAVYNSYFKINQRFPKECTCDSWGILHFGCKCGYVSARKAAGLSF